MPSLILSRQASERVLGEHPDVASLRKEYRKMALRCPYCRPDQGGTADQFQKLGSAHETLEGLLHMRPFLLPQSCRFPSGMFPKDVQLPCEAPKARDAGGCFSGGPSVRHLICLSQEEKKQNTTRELARPQRLRDASVGFGCRYAHGFIFTRICFG